MSAIGEILTVFASHSNDANWGASAFVSLDLSGHNVSRFGELRSGGEMGKESKPSLWLRLLATFCKSGVLTFARLMIVGWYVYFAVNYSALGSAAPYLLLTVLALSIFGLWRLIDLLVVWLGLKDDDPLS